MDSLYAQLLVLPVGAALVLPLAVTLQGAEHGIALVVDHYPERRYAIGEHLSRPRPGKRSYLRIQRLSDEHRSSPGPVGADGNALPSRTGLRSAARMRSSIISPVKVIYRFPMLAARNFPCARMGTPVPVEDFTDHAPSLSVSASFHGAGIPPIRFERLGHFSSDDACEQTLHASWRRSIDRLDHERGVINRELCPRAAVDVPRNAIFVPLPGTDGAAARLDCHRNNAARLIV